MRKSFAVCLTMFALLLVGGCGEETIDASSKAAFDKSVERITNSLPTDEKKEEFVEAIQILGVKNVLFGGGDITNEAEMMKKMKETFGGKTADQVIAAARKVQAENEAEMKKLIDGK